MLGNNFCSKCFSKSKHLINSIIFGKHKTTPRLLHILNGNQYITASTESFANLRNL